MNINLLTIDNCVASIAFVFISSIRFNLRSSTVAKSCSDTTAVTASLGLSKGKTAIAALILVVSGFVGFGRQPLIRTRVYEIS